MAIWYREPRLSLAPFIELFWFCREDLVRPLTLQRILPTGGSQLIVNLIEDRTRVYDTERIECCESQPGTVLTGVQSRFSIIDTAEQQLVAGVCFRPGGTHPFFQAPACEIAGAHVPLDALWGARRTSILRERLLAAPSPNAQLDVLEQTFTDAFVRDRLHPAVTYALNAFHGVPHAMTISSVSSAIGLSPKRFIERFKTEVGVTPKAFCRIRRFQRAVKAAHAGRDVDWSDVALSCGYYDQAHFIHDFRAFSGITPTLYRASRTSYQNHVKFLQSATGESLGD
jgi:AraC-like DNA-binding protein